MQKIQSNHRNLARASRGLVNGWRLLLTLALICLTLLNAGQGLLCMTSDAGDPHHHEAMHSGEQAAAIAEFVQALDESAPASTVESGASSADCLHCACLHAPLFTRNIEALAFHMPKLSQRFPALVEKVPTAPLSANFRPPIYA